MHVKAEHISKSFDDKLVVANFSFEARAGFITGIIGDSRAGKTTILRMLLGIVKPDEGYISFDDNVLSHKILDATGYLPEERGVYQQYTLNEILVYFARLKNLPRKKAQVEAVRLMDRFNLIEQMETPVQKLPEEVQQKVELMITLIHNPDLIILDEPFHNMVAENQTLIRKMVQRLREDGKTIILATGQIEEAELLCDEITLLHQGETLMKGRVDDMLEKFKHNLIEVEGEDNLQPLKQINGVQKMIQKKQVAQLFIDKAVSPQKVLDEIIRTVNISRIEIKRPGLKDIYTDAVQQYRQAAL